MLPVSSLEVCMAVLALVLATLYPLEGNRFIANDLVCLRRQRCAHVIRGHDSSRALEVQVCVISCEWVPVVLSGGLH